MTGASEDGGGGAFAGPDSPGPDPLADDPRVAVFFGARYSAVAGFTGLLRELGPERGLVGPRELNRLWERHILNSAAVVPFLPAGTVADVGSGAGLPGLVIAAMEPKREVVLIEPMERRATWLGEVSGLLGLKNVRVIRARAEDVRGVGVRAVTARAVAPLAKLVRWCAPLAGAEGEMLFLKGRSAVAEVEAAQAVIARAGFHAEVMEAPTLEGLAPTTVVRLSR